MLSSLRSGVSQELVTGAKTRALQPTLKYLKTRHQGKSKFFNTAAWCYDCRHLRPGAVTLRPLCNKEPAASNQLPDQCGGQTGIEETTHSLTGGGAEWTYENEPVVHTVHTGLGLLSCKLQRIEQLAALLRYNHTL